MSGKLNLVTFFLLFLTSFCRCSCAGGQDSGDNVPESVTAVDTVGIILDSMSLREKVCQMFFIRPEVLSTGTSTKEFEPSDRTSVTSLDSAMTAFCTECPVGGFCIFAANVVTPEQLTSLTAQLHALPHHPLVCVDEEGGRVLRIASNPAFGLRKTENMTALASSDNPDQVYQAARYIGSYLRQYGIDVDFAPVADVNTNPENMVISTRAFSDNPDKAAKMVVKYLDGLKAEGIAGCLKHYPGHGDVREDTHKSCACTSKTWDEMLGCELIPFKAGIEAGAGMIMVAHISAPGISGSDIPSTMSRVLLMDKLRGELGYDGLIITDSMTMGAVTNSFSPSEAVLNAVLAGVDIVLFPYDVHQAVDTIVDAVEKGLLTRERIDDSVRRIISLKLSLQNK